jgi:hypothetical protein
MNDISSSPCKDLASDTARMGLAVKRIDMPQVLPSSLPTLTIAVIKFSHVSGILIAAECRLHGSPRFNRGGFDRRQWPAPFVLRFSLCTVV